jgi:hypothetical protein
VPGRLIASTKSWLCHPGVDRTAPVLPWGAPPDVQKLSPVQASAMLLRHLSEAWNTAHPNAPLAGQPVVITVPASFDESARALTVSAAREAGLQNFTLLEEPQAAFYNFTARHRHDLDAALRDARLVLVIDIGGGTSDFTLVQVTPTEEGPELRRIAVGDHLMLGGDNMDAALSRKAEERMLGSGRKLSSAQWGQLTQMARMAKESLLGINPPAHHNLSIVAQGSRLIGGALSASLTREETEEAILDGFFPRCTLEATPHRSARVALQEMGLPYAQDPAVTRHLAAFLRMRNAECGVRNEDGARLANAPEQSNPSGTSHGSTTETLVPSRGTPIPNPHSTLHTPHFPGRPDAILLNGGVFNSPAITRRLVEVVSAWWPDAPPIPLLHHDSLDLAVARGAAFYGLARRGLARKITGGAAHALYVGLEKAGSATPLALCVIPRGQEECEPVDINQQVFQLALGKPVRFTLFSSASDRLERAGEIVPLSEDMQPLPAIHTLLKGATIKATTVPVHLRATLTEIGTLELWCVAQQGDQRWRLEFEARMQPEGNDDPKNSATDTIAVTESIPAAFGEARRWVERIYPGKREPGQRRADAQSLQPGSAPPKDARQLWASLERSLGPREAWRLPVLRELWTALFAGAQKRRRSPDNERVFFQLLGYTLRPGFGYALDDWRCEQTAPLFAQSIQAHKDKAIWKEFWIAWRRLAGGLSPARQTEIWGYLKPHLAQRIPPGAAKTATRPKGIQPEDLDEMVRLAASLEHLPSSKKAELGNWILARLRDTRSVNGPWTWALGRLGARVPLYGSIHEVVPPEHAAAWIQHLLTPNLLAAEGTLFALAQLARRTGDRSRDIEETPRHQVLEALKAAQAPESWTRQVAEVVSLDLADNARVLGDSLPAGLVIV